MKILIFGQHGQLARALAQRLQSDSRFEATFVGSSQCDLHSIELIQDIIKQSAPDWVINASAYTQVDLAETEQQKSNLLNHKAPAEMARVCSAENIEFIHFSTDYVFPGNQPTPLAESDATNPKTVYGHTKLLGEQAVLAAKPESLIFRTAWVFDRDGKNFVNTMLRLAQNKQQISVVDDQVGSPTYAADLADITIQCIEKIAFEDVKAVYGIFHVTGMGQTSWYGFCKEIYRLRDITHVEVLPISSDAYPTPAVRPLFSVLDNTKLLKTYGVRMPMWQDALARCLLG